MKIFKRNNPKDGVGNQSGLAELALKNIHDGVIITDKSGVIQFINPAAINMTECGSADKAIGLDYGLLLKLESKEGRELPESENPLIQAMSTGRPLDPFQSCLIASQSDKRIPIAVSVMPTDGLGQNRIITFRNITKELAEEGEQTEFISTASHEMRTPVASIEGYLSLALNPQTAAIDERARGYLNAAHAASQHLGKLFQDLLDVTKLDDGKIKPRFEPAEMVGLVKTIADDYLMRAKDAKLSFTFGSNDSISFDNNRQMNQVVYGYVDVNFMREILDNLIENAIKYTPAGGSIYVNVRGDGDRVLINVTDTGIGISADDLGHIFQKFYRADNSDTRTIGGTGLGLYLVKQRAEAMGGRVWAESAFGEGSTFYVSLPRITSDEYEKRMIVVRNQQMQKQLTPTPSSPPAPQTVAPATAAPVMSVMQPRPAVTPPAPPAAAPPISPPTPQPIQPQINNNLNGVQQ
ncbi:sensor histidine kinase [Candidatus Nanosyncoccus alces]|uniref:histidine kinase n=1 Tax=Candidatus Nanosyncoccus alces TaxID=2171997 RepID=A0ABY0FL51_9BACT|nr:ATP-binding protein [Candidatus Nanosyncoccus alces]RYC74486.1 Sensor protein kinase WalK [Candidatus Nanosyncoccus alces]